MNSKPALKLEEHISFMGWPDCLRLSNSEVELIIPTVIGLRILHFGFIGEKNVLYVSPEDKGKQGGGEWRIYGGHRLWIAPEEMPKSYAPDNDPVSYYYISGTLKLMQPEEVITGIVKEIEISLSPEKNQVRVLHRLINQNRSPLKLAAWAITALAPGGKAIIPQEPYGEGNEYLLPTRSMALWPFTRMDDPRWNWGSKFILAKQDPALDSEQKIGVFNKQGWAAYCVEDQLFIKVFKSDPLAEHADFNSNNEVYINGKFLELETLGPYLNLPPLGITEHIEYWQLSKGRPDESETSIERAVLPLVTDLQNSLK